MNRKISIGLVVLWLVVLTGCRHEDAPVRPNILLVTTDGQAWEDVAGKIAFLTMPAIEKLMKEGVVFDQHYCSAPISMPARYSMISGRYPHHHQMTDNGVNWLPDEMPTIMEKLSQAGYYTVGIGKMDFKPWERTAGFDKRIISDGWGNSAADTLKQDHYYQFLKEAELNRWDYIGTQKKGNGDFLQNWPLNDSLMIDRFIGAEAARFLGSKELTEKKNWMVWISFNGPDINWTSKNQKSDQKYPKPRIREGELDQKPQLNTLLRYRFYKEIACAGDENFGSWMQSVDEAKKAFYGSLQTIDRQIGVMLEVLNQRHDLENTVVIFTSIRGLQLGDHHLLGSGSFYERTVHVPLVLWCPEKWEHQVVNSFSSHTDIFPTLAELAGIAGLGVCDGSSLLPVIQGEKRGADQAFLENPEGQMLVTRKFKFSRYAASGEGELYERISDPEEFFNVFDSVSHQKTIDSLSAILSAIHPLFGTLDTIKSHFPSEPITELILTQGMIKLNHEVPQFSGGGLKLVLNASFRKQANGPVLTFESDYFQGFSLFVEKGQLFFGIRNLNQEAIYPIPGTVSEKRANIVLTISRQGELEVMQDNRVLFKKNKTIWPTYSPMGKTQNLTKALFTGVSGFAWSQPYGNLKRGFDLEGKVHQAKLSMLSNKKP